MRRRARLESLNLEWHVKLAESGEAPEGNRRGRRPARTRSRRAGLAATALFASAALALAGCSSGGSPESEESAEQGRSGDSAQSKADAAAAKNASDAVIGLTPRTGADNVPLKGGVKAAVKSGKLTKVTLTAVSSGAAVPGEFAADGSTWRPAGELELATKYRLTATAKDSEGRKETKRSTFTTLTPQNTFVGFFTPEDGSTVGVGMPVSINFNKPVENKAEVQRKITVRSSSGQEVAGHWFSDTRLDLRPNDYWQAGSQVTLGLRLRGVQASDGVYGTQSKDVTFTVGRSQVSTVDVKTKKMTVRRDGKVLRTLPITAGSEKNPTYNGAMVISEKFKETRMDGATVGFVKKDGKGEYDIPDVPHAMRLSTSGTFVHGNYWSPGAFGNVNASHGCIGLEDVKGAKDQNSDGAWFFRESMIGDVVKVVNSPDKTIAPDNGFNGWNMSWADWKAGSAL